MAATSLLTADAISLALAIVRGPEWGVYSNGRPVIQPATQFSQQVDAALAPVQILASILGAPNLLPVSASLLDFDFRQAWAISNYQVERGSFASYNKVTRPYDVRLRLACSGSASKRQSFVSSILTMADSTSLFDIVTPEVVFTSCNVSHVSWPRRADHGVSVIIAEIGFQKIRETGVSLFGITIEPSSGITAALGSVQPIATGAVTALSLAGGIR